MAWTLQTRTYLKDKPVALSVWKASQENARRCKRGRRWPAAVIAFAFSLLAQCNRRTYEDQLKLPQGLLPHPNHRTRSNLHIRFADGAQHATCYG